MNFKRVSLILLVLLFVLITAGCSGKTDPTPSGDKLPAQSANEFTLPAGYVILDQQTGDITGDGKPKDILLVGRKPYANNSNFSDDLSIIVRDGTSQNALTVKLPGVSGYDGKLFVGDFDGDKVNDVLVTIVTGGSGGIIEHRIVTFAGEPKIIFGAEENKGIVITGRFIDGFKYELTEKTTNRTAIVDLANKREVYIQANLFDASGNLLRRQDGWINSFGELRPVDLDRDGVYELRGQQSVKGMYNADTVASIYSIWKYEKGKWIAKQIDVSSILLGYGEK